MAETLNPSEAVYGFAAWLTCRKEKIVMSASDDAGIIANLVRQFCRENNLPKVSKNWPNNLIHPSGEVAAPGIGHNQEEAADKCQCPNGLRCDFLESEKCLYWEV